MTHNPRFAHSYAQGSMPSANQIAEVQEDERLRRDWILVAWSAALFSFGFTVYNSVFQNYLKFTFDATVWDLGRLEALREVPGLLTSITAGILASLAESRVAALGLLICGVGIGLTTSAPQYWPLVGLTVFWSVGFHLYSSMSSAITLNLAKGKEGGRHLGRLGGIGATATIAALGLSTLLAKVLQTPIYQISFIVGGIAIVGSAVCIFSLSHHSAGGERQPIILRKEYGLYYLLIFLEGCRRQIFSIFASFALIKAYNVPVDQMLILQFVNALLISVTAPAMGRVFDRIGERKPLMWYAVGLILVFAGYGFIKSKEVLFALFILDNVLFSFSVGFTTYLNRIVRPGERTPCIAMGVTMNHIAAVTVPVFGAMLWTSTGNYQLPFLIGVVIAIVSLIATSYLPHGRAEEESVAQ